MNRVKPVYQYTMQLIELLEKMDLDRDEKIQLIQDFLAKREESLRELAGSYSDEEIALGRQLVVLSGKLESLLEREKLMIQRDMKNLHAKKETSQKYLNPYQSLVAGGVFYDKKK
ncbi:flagellar protein FliT [Bacillota bacterium Lsc_1132]